MHLSVVATLNVAQNHTQEPSSLFGVVDPFSDWSTLLIINSSTHANKTGTFFLFLFPPRFLKNKK